MADEFVSILMLTHNAPEYVEISVRSTIAKTEGVRYELIVVDNASAQPTRDLVVKLRDEGLIHKLQLMDRNTLFAEGNNIAASLVSPEATHFLLLNSDVEIKSPGWLRHLLDVHVRGMTAYGVAVEPDRVDGYCLLVDADLYRKHPLDEGHQWWWAVTKQQATILNEGYSVRGYAEHEQYLHHFGGKSGSAFKNAKGMNVTREEVLSWFNGLTPTVIDRQADMSLPGRRSVAKPSLLRRVVRKIFR